MARILVVDDVVDNVKLLSYDLSDLGYDVMSAYSGKQALDVARQEQPDAILLDIVLPDIDGISVCRQLKANPALRHIPIVMISAKTEEADVVHGLDAGAMDYVTKPFSRDIVAARVRSAVRIKTDFDTIQEMNRKLDDARRAAESANRVKSVFLATMSHELRTPLNSVLGFTSVLLQGLAGPLNEEQDKQLGMVESSARHLLDLINDVLDISKIEAGQLSVHAEPFDVREAIEKVARTTRPLAEQKSLELVVEIAPGEHRLVSDRRRVEQVLLNLVGNAIKFTDTGQVRVECEPAGDRLVLRVADTGTGIKRTEMDRLFTPFQQLESTANRAEQGTGLGLSICKKLLELLGGSIRAESDWGAGSTFTVELPLD